MSILGIDKTSFKGRVGLSGFSGNVKLDQSIDQYEYDYLNKLLGPVLYEEFKTELAGTPAQKWIDLRDGKVYQYNDQLKVRFVGVKEMCIYFIYAEHILNDIDNTPSGSKDFNSVNSTEVSRSRIKNNSNEFYNYAVNYYNDAIKFIRKNITDYSDFVPQFIEYR